VWLPEEEAFKVTLGAEGINEVLLSPSVQENIADLVTYQNPLRMSINYNSTSRRTRSENDNNKIYFINWSDLYVHELYIEDNY
jgi:hypothetical protein